MNASRASVTVKLHGGPFDGQSAIAYGAQVGGLIDVNHRRYRITQIDSVPRWNELIASATFEEKPRPRPK